jgi:hypothetical protein
VSEDLVLLLDCNLLSLPSVTLCLTPRIVAKEFSGTSWRVAHDGIMTIVDRLGCSA